MKKEIAVLNQEGRPILATHPVVWDPEEQGFRWSCGGEYWPDDGVEGLRRFLERLTVVSAADEKAVLMSTEVVSETYFAVRLQRAGRRTAVALFDSLGTVQRNIPDWLLSLSDLRKAVG